MRLVRSCLRCLLIYLVLVLPMFILSGVLRIVRGFLDKLTLRPFLGNLLPFFFLLNNRIDLGLGGCVYYWRFVFGCRVS